MKKYATMLLLLLLSACLTHAEAKTIYAKSDTIRVLAIGNSFSDDATEQYLYELGKDQDVTFIIGNLYIPGCSLQTHWECAQSGKADYEYRKRTADGVHTNKVGATILDGIKDEKWDYITVQQNSGNSGFVDTYFPYLTNLLTFVKAHATNPKVKYAFHMTWAYQNGSDHPDFPRYDKSQLTMYNDIVKATQIAVKKVRIRIVIPSGTAVQNGRNSVIGDNYNRDGYHLNLLYGRYTAACTWFEKLTGLSVLNSHYAPEGVSAQYIYIARKAAHEAVKHPYQITTILTPKVK